MSLAQLEKDLIRALDTLKRVLGNDVLMIYYNPCIKNPMKLGDENSLFAYLKYLPLKRLSVMLYGSGGNLKAGCAMGEMLKLYLSYYESFVPFSCCSSLCYTFLSSRKLVVLDSANITQIDPIVEIDEEKIRLIRAIRSKDPDLSAKAKQMFNEVIDLIPEILYEKKSLYKYKKNTYLTKNEEMEKIIDLFMNKEEHASKITYEELCDLNLNVIQSSNRDLLTACKNVVDLCKKILQAHDKRLLILASGPLDKYKKRILISES